MSWHNFWKISFKLPEELLCNAIISIRLLLRHHPCLIAINIIYATLEAKV